MARAEARAVDGDRVEVCSLWQPQWDGDALVGLRNELAAFPSSEGRARPRILAVEPVPGLGWRRWLQWAATPWWRRRLGHHFNRDVPIEARFAGFRVDEIDRFATGPLGLRTYAYLELSVHPRDGAGDGSEDGPGETTTR